MYSAAYIPEDLKTSVFILLPKKPQATDCSDYRTISLMCHIFKLLLSIIMRRMSQKIEREISDRQTGFRKNSGTREAIFSLKVDSWKATLVLVLEVLRVVLAGSPTHFLNLVESTHSSCLRLSAERKF
ncbi:RNA-directed DNA polymerase from mobile element jockey-like [Elysia marginata]|uniref:RNA-directed DNA polymerase from mobile element jockey-like n=1 Tax=Elysia marginata TaxID=1093978 RepID=A0AAV4I261_9GAST|nr:RNA-directed DNA polymerase from mobile element jockey-like [Elysia marginata]